MIPTDAISPNPFTCIRNADSNEPQVTMVLNRTDLLLLESALENRNCLNDACNADEERLMTLLEAIRTLRWTAYRDIENVKDGYEET